MNDDLSQWKILIIEDDRALLGLMKHVLERARYAVFCAANGSDGILLNEQKDPDLILLDLHMPDMDGIETLRNIRTYDDEVIVVILTGYPGPDSIRDAADLNVSEYLSKPFDNQHLVSVIRTALET